MKRCTKYREEEKKRRSKTAAQSQWLKKCSRKLKSSSVPAKSWSDLDLDLLGEIRKRLFWADHIRFGGVCKSWLAAEHEKRAGDVLPWLMMVYPDDISRTSYYLYQPTSSSATLNLNHPTISDSIDLGQFFDLSRLENAMPFIYRDGCLILSVCDLGFTCSYYLLFSIATKKFIKLPQFYHPIDRVESDSSLFQAVSTNPMSPHCVFLACFVSNYHEWSIGIFRHGDTHWTTTHYTFEDSFGYPFVDDVVFLGGLFYFLCYDGRLASYDITSAELKVESFSTQIHYGGISIHKFFELDGELMLTYYDRKSRKFLLTSYDWSHKVWVPVKSLGDRSLFLSMYSVYVDATNYYGVSPNKIYIQRDGTFCVYSLENGQLLESTSSGLRIWNGVNNLSPCSLWVEPPDLLLQKVGYRPTEDDGERIQWSYAN